jgi:hypothetical protein
MGKLQRPATLKEFVIQSLLAWRDTAATLVDHEDEAPTLLRRPDSEPPVARDTLTSYVFDLGVVPRVASSPSDSEILRDTLPAPPPVAALALPSRPARAPRRAPKPLPARPARRAPTPAAAAATASPGTHVLRLVLFALVVLALLASARS